MRVVASMSNQQFEYKMEKQQKNLKFYGILSTGYVAKGLLLSQESVFLKFSKYTQIAWKALKQLFEEIVNFTLESFLFRS